MLKLDAVPFQVQTISDTVYLFLKKSILQGELTPGQRLLVMDIAQKFDISQAPVREALERLKHEGLISAKTNKGSVVSDITAKEIKDIAVMRKMTEGFAIRATLPILQSEDFDYLESTIREMGAAIASNDMLKIVEWDLAFHGFFYERCDNHVVLDTWNQMKTKVMRFMAISNKHFSTDHLVEEHLALIDVLKTGDAREAEKRFIFHMKAYEIVPLT
jgi:DNA-binding GntR family transcriptional regulator